MFRLRAAAAAAILVTLALPFGNLAQADDELVTGADGQRLVTGREVIDLALARTTPETQWGNVTQHHDWEKTLSIAMDDPWVSGIGHYVFDVDAIGASPDNVGNMRGGVARDRGTLRIENEGGAWEGPCDSVSLDGGGHIIGSCVLSGSGGYEGYTYLQVHDWGSGGTTEGVIFSGSYPDEYPAFATCTGS